MQTELGIVISLVFVGLAVWHVVMALRPTPAESAALPSVGGRSLFAPSRTATLAVAVLLLLCACLVAATAGLVFVDVARAVLSGLSYALAVGLLARAVGEFKYVGFFKKVRDSRFATLDTFLYSPLCLLLSLGVATVAAHNGA